MESILPWVLGKMSIGGPWLAVLLVVGQFYFSAERVAMIEALKKFKDLFWNIPRRWRSEHRRIAGIILKLDKKQLEDAAAQKRASLEVKGAIRVFAGIIEDALCAVVDLVVAVLPLLVSIIKALRRGK